MVIDKIGNINNIIEPKKSNPVASAKETKKKDSIEISSEGKKAADASKVAQLVKDSPDIRADRIQEIKDQIANGTYNFDDPKMLDMVADKIATFLMRK
ncbi:MAG TPA: flagellar biosynthesis anti-sigma factor FlgM [Spirochaetota bacterium]|nr:flagellar biosynthesis anti-sigma factor FlgM [Spirochaetota bacterium]HOD13854.1 flagellar biosynthesis anti-sigma factor FlgM [Spirochaetota bacterium]HPG51454.1 flagellar biosynthesis anti-sigma factor FlgM [Spirochaetota bacterium]HPN13241.1 flagellar biosynthesis anti-sigma factor FlgM [Spirochaetota bacterium]HQL80668.1 flagellar biosynthesis anti-sigma factor FlgM [Spirochaetota bacterium]